MTFDPEEFVTLYCVGRMTLRAAVERVMAQELQDLDAAIFRYGEPSILDRTTIEKIAAEWG